MIPCRIQNEPDAPLIGASGFHMGDSRPFLFTADCGSAPPGGGQN